jgi:outer membrane protein TolC
MRFWSGIELLMNIVRSHGALDKLKMLGVNVWGGIAAAVVLLVQITATPVRAETMERALLRAYQNNPQLNAQRASVRAADEAVPQALSGYRPKAALTLLGGVQFADQLADGSAGKKIEQGDQGPHSTTAIRPPTRPVPRRARFSAPGKACG